MDIITNILKAAIGLLIFAISAFFLIAIVLALFN